MSGMPICECATFWESHHPECPVRREIERLQSERDHYERTSAALSDKLTLTEFMRDALKRECDRLDALINNPHTDEFAEAVRLEAAHQQERWSTDHDKGKSPSDWLWLVAYLATKATQAERYDDSPKYLHHIITTAAACLNWHAHASGAPHARMKPGAPEPAALSPTNPEPK